MGILEVSRSIGDGPYKNHGVTCLPDIKRCQLTSNDRWVFQIPGLQNRTDSKMACTVERGFYFKLTVRVRNIVGFNQSINEYFILCLFTLR